VVESRDDLLALDQLLLELRVFLEEGLVPAAPVLLLLFAGLYLREVRLEGLLVAFQLSLVLA